MARASRMSGEKQWRNIGRGAARKDIPVERVLTGKPSIDNLIRDGYETELCNPPGDWPVETKAELEAEAELADRVRHGPLHPDDYVEKCFEAEPGAKT